MKKTAMFACVLAAGLFFSSQVLAEGSRVYIEGNASFWWVIQEQVENGIVQRGSEDEAAQEASGFNFRLGRLTFLFQSPDSKIEALMRLRLEDWAGIIDLWGAYRPVPWFNVYMGNMKIPSTSEVLTRDHLTDFISRTTFAKLVGDYSLARTPYISPFMATYSYNRDMGIAFKGSVPDEPTPWLRYFVMISNGIGGTRYVGGKESGGTLYTNDFGDYYYGARLETQPMDWFMLGGHYSQNTHDNAMYEDKSSVVDLDRTVWTADLKLVSPWGTKLYGFYGEGKIEDFWTAQKYEYDYSGWGLWVIQGLFNQALELCARYDTFVIEYNQDGNETEQNNWTFGANFMPDPHLRLQLNYVWKDTVNQNVDDLDDDILYLNLQFIFDAAMEL